MPATWITLFRFPILLAVVVALHAASPMVRLAGAALLFAGLMLDTVDGIVARRRGQVSLLGGVLDIAADRTYELVLWVGFADLRLIPLWVPLVVLVRTTLTDALRSLGIGQGTAPFDQPRGGLARFLVASSIMRTGYAAGKMVTLCGLAIGWGLAAMPGDGPPNRAASLVLTAARMTLWPTVALCLLRGLPVVLDPPGGWDGVLRWRSRGRSARPGPMDGVGARTGSRPPAQIRG
jgi:CDP-diacylglycerol--glycerol-3-phosphate 3-phosphatidyltransferase